MKRRHFLQAVLSVLILAPLNALAAVWNKAAFEAVKLEDASKNLKDADMKAFVDAKLPTVNSAVPFVNPKQVTSAVT